MSLPRGDAAYSYLANFLIGKIDYDLLGVTKTVIINSGFYHLFVISGFHIGLVFVMIYRPVVALLLILQPHRDYRLMATLLCLTLCVYYVYLCGFPISAIRAVTIITIYMLLRIFYIRSDNFNCLFLLFLLLLGLDSKLLTSPGFLYSFVNSMALVFYFSGRKLQVPSAIIPFNILTKFMHSSFVCFFASLPITLIFFHKIQFAGIFSNVIAIPYFIFLLFPLSLLAFLLNIDSLNLITFKMHKLLTAFADYIDNFSYLTIGFATIDSFRAAMIALACILLIQSKLRHWFLAVLVIATNLFTFQSRSVSLALTAIPRSIVLNGADTSSSEVQILTKSKFNLSASDHFNCTEKHCQLKLYQHKVMILKNSLNYQEFKPICDSYDLVINLSSNDLFCDAIPTISGRDLFFRKQIVILFDHQKFYITH